MSLASFEKLLRPVDDVFGVVGYVDDLRINAGGDRLPDKRVGLHPDSVTIADVGASHGGERLIRTLQGMKMMVEFREKCPQMPCQSSGSRT